MSGADTGGVVNLRRARKAKKRADDAAIASANRAAFGQTRSEKDAAIAEQAALSRHLDGVKRLR